MRSWRWSWASSRRGRRTGSGDPQRDPRGPTTVGSSCSSSFPRPAVGPREWPNEDRGPGVVGMLRRFARHVLDGDGRLAGRPRRARGLGGARAAAGRWEASYWPSRRWCARSISRGSSADGRRPALRELIGIVGPGERCLAWRLGARYRLFTSSPSRALRRTTIFVPCVPTSSPWWCFGPRAYAIRPIDERAAATISSTMPRRTRSSFHAAHRTARRLARRRSGR